MPTESELREALRSAPDAVAGPGACRDRNDPLNASAIIRKARAHRRPKRFVLGSATVLAVVGIAYGGFTAIPWPQTMLQSASDSAAGMPESAYSGLDASDAPPMESDLARRAAETSNRCGMPVVETGASASGLVLTTDFPANGPANGLPIDGTVTLTNTGQQRVTGTTGAQPTIVVSRDGVTVWHSNGAVRSIGILVDLAPGESMDYPASFTPVECAEGDETGLAFPSDLPPLSTGRYQVSALIELVPDTAVPDTADPDTAGAPWELIGGPSQDVALTGG